jgi:hypothetical protein
VIFLKKCHLGCLAFFIFLCFLYSINDPDNKGRANLKILKWSGFLLIGLILSIPLFSCSGSSGSGGGGNPAASQDDIISGSVQAPAGQIAFLPQEHLFEQFAKFLLPSANALISGLSPVPDGTTVELDRISDAGAILVTISTTTTSSGDFSFNLTKLGISFSSDLIVRVSNPSKGIQMRSFAGIGITNINPGSEAAVRIVLEMVASNPGMVLANFTPKEQNDVIASADLLSTVNHLSAGADIETTVTVIKNTISADTGVMAFITSASATGQTSDGPGDIGNYFPMKIGNAWNYQRTDSKSNSPPVPPFNMTSTFSGTKLVNNIKTFVNTESNFDNTGTSRESYLAKDKTSYSEYGESGAASALIAQIAPVINAILPLQSNVTFGQINLTGLNYGQDLDGDGINETVDVVYQAKVASFETLTVQAGTFKNVARFERVLTLTVHLSNLHKDVISSGPVTEWFAPGIGLIKSIQLINTTGLGQSNQDTIIDELIGFSVNGTTQGKISFQFGSAAQYASNNLFVGKSVIGDLNGDGLNDIVVRTGYKLLIYYQNPSGGFNPPVTLTYSDPCGLYQTIGIWNVDIGDLNNDGKQDLVLYADSSCVGGGVLVVYYQNPTTGVLNSPITYPVSGRNAGNLKIGDLNSDGLNDVVILADNITIYFQNPDGTLGQEHIITPNNCCIYSGDVYIADMNNDGHNDIVGQSGPLQVAVLKQNPNNPGTFGPLPDYYSVTTSYGNFVYHFAVGDLNNDGLNDIAVADPGNNGNLNIFLQNNQGNLNLPVLVPQGGAGMFDVKIGDVDRDGLKDIVESTSQEVFVFYQGTNHLFQAPVSYYYHTSGIGGCSDCSLSLGDVTGSGRLDALVTWIDEGIFVLPSVIK